MIPRIGQWYKNSYKDVLVEVVQIVDGLVKFSVLGSSKSSFEIGKRFFSGSLRANGYSTGEWICLEGQDKSQ